VLLALAKATSCWANAQERKPMDEHSHVFVAIYGRRADADAAKERLRERGLTDAQIAIVENTRAPGSRRMRANEEVLQDLPVEGAGFGVLAEAAQVAVKVTLFVASRLVRPLAIRGRDHVHGSRAGSAFGEKRWQDANQGKFLQLATDAILSGHAVLVADTATAAEATLARHIIGDSVKERDRTSPTQEKAWHSEKLDATRPGFPGVTDDDDGGAHVCARRRPQSASYVRGRTDLADRTRENSS